MNIRTHFLLIIFYFSIRIVNAQFVLLPTAITGTTILTFSVTVSAPGSVVYHPTADLYYISRCGLTSYPLQTLTPSNVVLLNTTVGLDTRGMWWNSNTGQMERNGFSTVGWSKIDLNGSNYALSSTSTIFTGMHQPDVQSVGAYDPSLDEVIFYFSGSVYKYARSTGSLISSYALTGTALTNVNSTSVIYTGVVSMEIGLLDWSAKKILLFDKSTGVFSGSSALPATAVTPSLYKFSYANNMVWLFHNVDNSWHSYIIWDQLLPVENIVFTGMQSGNSNILSWKIECDEEIDQYEIAWSGDGIEFSKLATLTANEMTDNIYRDQHPSIGTNYYSLSCKLKNERNIYSKIISVDHEMEKSKLIIYPNPATENIFVVNGNDENYYSLFNAEGKEIGFGSINSNQSVSVKDLKAGVYFLKIGDAREKFVKK